MWTIFEGPDGAGKSGLARFMSTTTAAALVHLGPPESPESALAECVSREPFGTFRPSDRLVSDRHHWGCPVYGAIYRPALNVDGYGDMQRGGWRFAEMFCVSRGAVIALVLADVATLRTRVEARGDDYIDLDDLQRIVIRYTQLAKVSANPVITINSEQIAEVDRRADYMRRIVADLLEPAFETAATAKPLAAWPEYVGPAKTSRLVISSPHMQERTAIYGGLDNRWKTTGVVPYTVNRERLERLCSHLGVTNVVVGYDDPDEGEHASTLSPRYPAVHVSELAAVFDGFDS